MINAALLYPVVVALAASKYQLPEYGDEFDRLGIFGTGFVQVADSIVDSCIVAYAKDVILACDLSFINQDVIFLDEAIIFN